MAKTGEAQTSGMSEIRGIDIDKLAKGFADEDIIFKRFVTNTPTSAREIRWYTKTAGFLEATTPSEIANVADGAQPFILEQSVTRTSSYVRKYFVESPTILSEDIKDSDIDMLAMNVRDLTRGIAYKVDGRIWDVMTQSRTGTLTINSIDISGAWSGTGTDTNPIKDILKAKRLIREYRYNPEGAELYLNAVTHENLIGWLISTKGSSIPQFASGKMEKGVVQELLGVRVIVSENVTSNYGCLALSPRAVTWKQFVPITARTIEEVGIGTKIRVWEEGEALLTDPRAVCLLSGTGTSS